MFTGLVEEVGKVVELRKRSKGAVLKIGCSRVADGTKVGDSVAVNGVCLTVVEIGRNYLEFFISSETLQRSNLGKLATGEPVNLERALKLGDRLGGHIVQGHVDAVTKVMGIKREGEGYRFLFKLPRAFAHLVIEKGSIAVDGVSLTVASLELETFSVAVIPHTYENTNLKWKRAGSTVNLEFDLIGKYVERMLTTISCSSSTSISPMLRQSYRQ